MKFRVFQDVTEKYFGEIDIDEKYPNVPMVHWNQLSVDEKGFYMGKLIITKEFSEDHINLVELKRIKKDKAIEKRVLYWDDNRGTSSIPLRFRRVE